MYPAGTFRSPPLELLCSSMSPTESPCLLAPLRRSGATDLPSARRVNESVNNSRTKDLLNTFFVWCAWRTRRNNLMHTVDPLPEVFRHGVTRPHQDILLARRLEPEVCLGNTSYKLVNHRHFQWIHELVWNGQPILFSHQDEQTEKSSVAKTRSKIRHTVPK